MTDKALDFAQLMQRLRDGDEVVSQLVVRRFERQIQALVRRRTGSHVRSKFDSEDVSQSVFRSFFVRHRGGQFQLMNWENLWGVLAVMAKRKCGHRHVHYQAQRRSVLMERPLAELDNVLQRRISAALRVDPEQSVILADIMQQLLADLSPRDQRIIELYIQHYALDEIGQRVGCAPRTIRRIIARFRLQFAAMAEA